MPKKQSNLTIEETFKRLDEIIENLEKDDISLEDSFKLYTEGMELAGYCNSQIDKVEKKVMAMNEEGGLSEL